MHKPRLLAVVQRYGDIVGGAEILARMVVQRLAPHLEVEVATTTSRDYWSWDHFFPEGRSAVDGVPVHRFRVRRRRPRDVHARERRAFSSYHSLDDESAFIEAQGPYAPELLEFLFARRDDFDHVIFFTYLYYTTLYGLPIVPERSVLVPTAHDEPPIRLSAYRSLFHAPRAIVYLSEEERSYVQGRFRNRRVPSAVAGAGVEVSTGASGQRFRERHGIDGPMLLYLGRISPSKSCDELLDFFGRWREADRSRRATLVLAGHAEMPVPTRSDVRHVGYLSEEEKRDAHAAADLFVLPSRFESLSIVSLESLAAGRPVICHADCAVVRGLVRRSGGGLYYRSFAEFSEILDLLLGDPALRRRLGESGREYVLETCTWPRVVETYLDVLAEVRVRNS